MITITAHPITDRSHVVSETFKSSSTARKWIALMKLNNWKVTKISDEGTA
jgi:hypothetical protein